MIKQIRPRNILSFGPTSEALELGGLNVFVGANASGKSNLIEVIGLLRSSPRELTVPIREGGGIGAWLWKGGGDATAADVEVVIECAGVSSPLRHRLAFAEKGQRFEIVDERVENEQALPGYEKPYFYFGYENGWPMLNSGGSKRKLERFAINPEKSILAQRRDPDHYPELTRLAEFYEGVRLYRDWPFGRSADVRRGQAADLHGAFLAEDASNLALVLSALRGKPDSKLALVSDLRELYDGVLDYEIIVEGGKAQLYLNEGNRMIPATRLSDGTLRYLSLLSVLHHPTPAPLIAIEEPELGLHPDIIPRVAELLRDAAQRTQLIVTTHSSALVDALSDTPESVVVTEKKDGATTFERLDRRDLGVWLDKYSLGELWARGDIGGTRW
ncbi:MAG: AAA family ATPase [Enhygromyxa sp.]